jgi:hypothetical protein
MYMDNKYQPMIRVTSPDGKSSLYFLPQRKEDGSLTLSEECKKLGKWLETQGEDEDHETK